MQRIRAVVLDDGTPPSTFVPAPTDAAGAPTADTCTPMVGDSTTEAGLGQTTIEETTDGAR